MAETRGPRVLQRPLERLVSSRPTAALLTLRLCVNLGGRASGNVGLGPALGVDKVGSKESVNEGGLAETGLAWSNVSKHLTENRLSTTSRKRGPSVMFEFAASAVAPSTYQQPSH
jgi:hypothetical protein